MAEHHLSQRGIDAPASPIRKLMPLARAAKGRGLNVYHLNIGQPDIETPREMIAAYQSYDATVLPYTATEGLMEYREALAEGYQTTVATGGGRPVTAHDVVVTVGGSEALLFAIAAVTDPGDEILLCEPFYTNYAGFAHTLGVGVRAVTTYASDGFQIDPERVAAAIGPRTRALVIPSPGNPTGVVLSEAVLGQLVEICDAHGIFFISDEVYRDFVYQGDEDAVAPSILGHPGAARLGIMVDSVSKRYSACGARVGALVTRNDEILSAVTHFAQARLSPAMVDQLAAMAALKAPATYLSSVKARYRARRDVLVSSLHQIGVHCETPEGAFYLVAPLPVDDADAFCRFLLTDFSSNGETVMVAPAAGFYATEGLGRNEVRIAYVLDEARLARSVALLGEALEAYGRQ